MPQKQPDSQLHRATAKVPVEVYEGIRKLPNRKVAIKSGLSWNPNRSQKLDKDTNPYSLHFDFIVKQKEIMLR